MKKTILAAALLVSCASGEREQVPLTASYVERGESRRPTPEQLSLYTRIFQLSWRKMTGEDACPAAANQLYIVLPIKELKKTCMDDNAVACSIAPNWVFLPGDYRPSYGLVARGVPEGIAGRLTDLGLVSHELTHVCVRSKYGDGDGNHSEPGGDWGKIHDLVEACAISLILNGDCDDFR